MNEMPTHERKLSRALVAFALAITGVGGYLLGSRRLRASPMAKCAESGCAP